MRVQITVDAIQDDMPADSQNISVHYIGPLLDSGRVDLFLLSDSLRGLGRLASRVNYLLYGTEADYRLELVAPARPGSVVIPVHLTGSLKQAEDLLTSKGVQALATLMGILGWGAIPAVQSLYKVFKRKQGRPLSEQDNLASVLGRLEDIERLLFVKIYNDSEVQAAIRAALRPLRIHGIVEIQTRRNDVVIDSVTKGDLLAADEAEELQIVEVDERVLNIEKVALMPHLAWHLADEDGPFDAKIQDPMLWERISRGERFGFGDRMRVELRTTLKRDATGRLNLERVIPKVIEVEHASQAQRSFPFEPDI